MCNWLIGVMAENLKVAAFVGALWSFIVEMFPAFGELSPAVKRWVMLALCMAVPVLALVVAAFGLRCPDVMFGADALGKALAAGAVAFMGSQLAHIRKL